MSNKRNKGRIVYVQGNAVKPNDVIRIYVEKERKEMLAVVVIARVGMCLALPLDETEGKDCDVVGDMIYCKDKEMKKKFNIFKSNFVYRLDLFTSIDACRVIEVVGVLKIYFTDVPKMKIIDKVIEQIKAKEDIEELLYSLYVLYKGYNEDSKVFIQDHIHKMMKNVGFSTHKRPSQDVEQGNIVYIKAHNPVGHEIIKDRFAIILYVNDDGSCLVAPISSKDKIGDDKLRAYRMMIKKYMIWVTSTKMEIEGTVFFEQIKRAEPDEILQNVGWVRKEHFHKILGNFIKTLKPKIENDNAFMMWALNIIMNSMSECCIEKLEERMGSIYKALEEL